MGRGARLGAVVAVLAAACAREPAWEWTAPPVLDEEALVRHLTPQGEEKLVLAHFWATW